MDLEKDSKGVYYSVPQPEGLRQLIMGFQSCHFTKLCNKKVDFSFNISSEEFKYVDFKLKRTKKTIISLGGLQNLSHLKWWASKSPTLRTAGLKCDNTSAVFF